MTARIPTVEPPYDAEVGAQLEAMMPAGVPPIALFRTFVRNLPMAAAMHGWGATCWAGGCRCRSAPGRS